MYTKYLKSKIQGLKITEKNLRYSGSIKLDINFIESANIKPYESVLVVNLSNGERFETYVIEGKRGSKVVSLQGGAARLGEVGDELIIMSFSYLSNEEKLLTKTVIYHKNNILKKVIVKKVML
ncbi:MAG: aspartate 1-decarboxylase [Endomicrobiia bacterium]